MMEVGNMNDLADRLKMMQQSWAIERRIDIEDGYCRSVNDNLFQPLSEDSRRDFESGDGSELGKNGGRGKIQALHSSSALVCNFFDYWRAGDLKHLAEALGISIELRCLAFERKFSTGLRGMHPNLDVVLYGRNGEVFAIESKFMEWMHKPSGKTGFSHSYFPEDRALWSECNLDGCQKLAEDLREGKVRFEQLNATQLLKHMLGLGQCQVFWKLFCIWYGPPDTITDKHTSELKKFAERTGDNESKFEAITYQEFFSRLCKSATGNHAMWRSYMQNRYFQLT
jgi:hypothetical protein